MPEIAEAARIVHFLRAHVVGKRIKTAAAIDDSSVFGKVGTTGDAVAKALTGKTVVSAGSQGKYFWLELDSAPHLVMHFGMTGWMHIKGMRTGYTNYYNKLKADEADAWPPKYCKFQFAASAASAASGSDTATDTDTVEVAYTDPRRFGRVRLVDCPGAQIRQHSPLAENGPDPVVDAATTFTEAYFVETLRRRHVPIKALLLDQAFLSGIGNWVGDEVLFHARLHPEQYCDAFSPAQMKALYAAVRDVCRTAVDLLGDSDRFPADWLFCHRWGKGSKTAAAARLPSGEPLAFVTVGGRTSCFAPGLQKKTGAVAPGLKEEPVPAPNDEGKPPAKGKAKTPKKAGKAAPAPPAKEVPGRDARKRKRGSIKEEGDGPKDKPAPPAASSRSPAKSTKPSAPSRTKKAKATETAEEKPTESTGRRRSARVRVSSS